MKNVIQGFSMNCPDINNDTFPLVLWFAVHSQGTAHTPPDLMKNPPLDRYSFKNVLTALENRSG